MKKILNGVFSGVLAAVLSFAPIAPSQKAFAVDPVLVTGTIYYGALTLLSVGVATPAIGVIKAPFQNRRAANYYGEESLKKEGTSFIETNVGISSKVDSAIRSVLQGSQGPQLSSQAMDSLISGLTSGDLTAYKLTHTNDSILKGLQQLLSINPNSCKSWEQGGTIVVEKGACFSKQAKERIKDGFNSFENSLLISDSLLLALSEDKQISKELGIFRQLQKKDQKRVSKLDGEILYSMESLLLIAGLLNKIGQSFEGIKQQNKPVVEKQYKVVIDYLQNIIRVGLYLTAARAESIGADKKALRIVSDNFWVAAVSSYASTGGEISTLDNILEKIESKEVKIQQVRSRDKNMSFIGSAVYHTINSIFWGGSIATLAMATGDVEFIESVIKPSLEFIYGSDWIHAAESLMTIPAHLMTYAELVMDLSDSNGVYRTTPDIIEASQSAKEKIVNGSYGFYAGLTLKGILNTISFFTEGLLVPNGKRQVSKLITKIQKSRARFYKQVSAKSQDSQKAVSACVKVLSNTKTPIL